MISLAELLDFEAANPRAGSRKEALIRPTFNISAVRYYQQLTNILTTESLLTQALAHDPSTTRRLLRLREERVANRNTRQGIHP